MESMPLTRYARDLKLGTSNKHDKAGKMAKYFSVYVT